MQGPSRLPLAHAVIMFPASMKMPPLKSYTIRFFLRIAPQKLHRRNSMQRLLFHNPYLALYQNTRVSYETPGVCMVLDSECFLLDTRDCSIT